MADPDARESLRKEAGRLRAEREAEVRTADESEKGFTVRESDWESASREIRERAVFDFGCEAASLELPVLSTCESGDYLKQVGVTGQKATFVRSAGGWVANTHRVAR